jgi:hypothetical protein
MLITGSIVKEEKVGRVTDLADSRSKDCSKALLRLWSVELIYKHHVFELMSGWNSFRMPFVFLVSVLVLISDQRSRLHLLRFLHEITAPSKR